VAAVTTGRAAHDIAAQDFDGRADGDIGGHTAHELHRERS